MTDLQRIALRMGDVRTRLAELGALDELDDEQRSELDKLRNEYGDLERRSQALTIAADEPTDPDGDRETRSESAEDRERARLVEAASMGQVFASLLEHRSMSGAERDLQQAFGLAENQVPLAMLQTDDDLERRAVTPAPTNVGTNQQAVVPAVFSQACASFLGIDMPTVPVGDAVFPVMTSRATAHTPAEGADAAETTGSFSAEVLTPKRLQASYFYSREDRARFANMDSSLRMNLSEALADGLDKEVLAGTDGLLTGTNLADHDATAQTTFGGYRTDLVYGRVDGRFASVAGEVKIVMGAASYAHASEIYRSTGNVSVDDSALDSLMRVSGGVKVSAHVPAVSSDKQEAIVRLGNRRDMVAAVWEGLTIIPDEVTKAKSGEIVVTAVLLHAVKILRADGFYKQELQLA